MKRINRLGCLFILAFSASLAGTAPAQSGGSFQIEKSVIAGGGGQATGGAFVLNGTIGEHVSGTVSTGGSFALDSGFWGSGGSAPIPTYTVSGRVLTSDGARGLRNATVSMTSSQNVVRVTTTSSFGFFTFDNVTGGDVYTIRVSSRLYRYQPHAVQVNSDLTRSKSTRLNSSHPRLSRMPSSA